MINDKQSRREQLNAQKLQLCYRIKSVIPPMMQLLFQAQIMEVMAVLLIFSWFTVCYSS